MNRRKSLGRMKLACMVTLALGAALFLGVAPKVVAELDGPGTGRMWIDLIYVWAVGALCFASLWEAWRICGEIGRDNSFSRKNARSLRRISRYMAAACGLMAIGFALCLCTGLHAAPVPGLAALGTCIALVFALFASAMAELIEAGAALKDENDLTI